MKTVMLRAGLCGLLVLAATHFVSCRTPENGSRKSRDADDKTSTPPGDVARPLSFEAVLDRLESGELPTDEAPPRDLMDVLVEGLCRDRDLGASEELVTTILPIAEHFTAADAEKLVAHDRVPTILLGLTARSLRGERAALDELMAISVEYGGDLTLFIHALKKLFPAALNPDLYKQEEAGQLRAAPFAVLRDVRVAAAEAKFHRGPPAGWQLTP